MEYYAPRAVGNAAVPAHEPFIKIVLLLCSHLSASPCFLGFSADSTPANFSCPSSLFQTTLLSLMATLLIDDQDSQVKYLCPTLNQAVAGSYYNNTWSTVRAESSCSDGWFQYTFHGTGIQVAASIPKPSTYSVKIDNEAFVSQSGDGAYDSPALPEGEHTLTYSVGSGTALPAFDYLTVTAGTNTPLDGKTLVIDDTDGSIAYTGSWTIESPVPLNFDYSTSLHKNSAHWASRVGDSLHFQFRGSSISVLGIAANISGGGNITATYTLDGISNTRDLPTGTLDSLPMVQLFHADVQPGDHTLIVNITSIQAPCSLGFDLITYNASFPNISSMTGAAATATSSADSKTPSWGPKVGIAIGVVAGVSLVLSILIIFWQRNRLRKDVKAKSLEVTFNDSKQKRDSKPFVEF
ncbi:unnamed protein product [Cyclocybe aegerita]|uniref:Uncharacterized protein n=1 Tax=Cyclocybe aegerita TaxID=1973307 RepID=A0A8S0XP16_CYCAE|nr:unnamed protein product [Cyclocybe aegerita]